MLLNFNISISEWLWFSCRDVVNSRGSKAVYDALLAQILKPQILRGLGGGSGGGT